MKNIQVYYHANCLDGAMSAYVAWQKFNYEADYIPISYYDAIHIEPPEGMHGLFAGYLFHSAKIIGLA